MSIFGCFEPPWPLKAIFEKKNGHPIAYSYSYWKISFCALMAKMLRKHYFFCIKYIRWQLFWKNNWLYGPRSGVLQSLKDPNNIKNTAVCIFFFFYKLLLKTTVRNILVLLQCQNIFLDTNLKSFREEAILKYYSSF